MNFDKSLIDLYYLCRAYRLSTYSGACSAGPLLYAIGGVTTAPLSPSGGRASDAAYGFPSLRPTGFG